MGIITYCINPPIYFIEYFIHLKITTKAIGISIIMLKYSISATNFQRGAFIKCPLADPIYFSLLFFKKRTVIFILYSLTLIMHAPAITLPRTLKTITAHCSLSTPKSSRLTEPHRGHLISSRRLRLKQVEHSLH